MKIVQVYNQQRSTFGGEESVIDTVRHVLERNGHSTVLLMRSSRGLERSLFRKMRIAVTGVYNRSAYIEMQHFLNDEQPDIVHVHSVYPNWSPSILVACQSKNIPVVFHVHCHILTCPNWYHLRNGKLCNRCFAGKEQWCLLTNCRNSIAESTAYALRSLVARKARLFQKNVSLFVAVSDFLRQRLITAGYSAAQIEVLHNAVCCTNGSALESVGPSGEYFGYAGRLSIEKGVDTLIEAARICGLPVRIAGEGPELDRLRAIAPSNVTFLGRLPRRDIQTFYQQSRGIVVPSRCYEAFCLSAAEAMIEGRPVIASRIGALPELIQNNLTGVLVEAGNVRQLADSMLLLWRDERLRSKLGKSAKTWAETHWGEDIFYRRLIGIYERAAALLHKGVDKRADTIARGRLARSA